MLDKERVACHKDVYQFLERWLVLKEAKKEPQNLPKDTMGGNKELQGCIECAQVPVFRPTEAEWRDPLRYLASIRRQGELIGMAKIVPPPRWEGQHTPDRESVRFKTKTQAVHELQWKDTVTEAKQFWAMFNAFQESTGASKSRKKPVFAGQEIDLYRLYRVVGKRGGFVEVCAKKCWKDIVTAMEVRVGNWCLCFTHLEYLAMEACQASCERERFDFLLLCNIYVCRLKTSVVTRRLH